ncbi:hypothetical protein [Hyphococcus sp.]|uniref:hypothetical protein n=1 Tax=Hyphococcus sp. TaxID=2038636 RepID=UPI00207ED1B9|nr:MAG: hypothetical protein DHS20C04_29110 [Marinicaulis sp.]
MPSSTSSSDALRAPAPLSYFDPEHVDRPVPGKPWRALCVAALIATIALTAGWEIFWRGKGMIAGDYKNTNALWAQERRKATDDATVMIGSSRIFFDVDLDIWEELSGVRPVQLALEGTSPRVFLKDLAADETFHGLVIVGVTAPVFFTQDGGLRADVLDYTRDQTPAQRLDHVLSYGLEETLAFYDEQTRPATQLIIWPWPLRKDMAPLFYPRKLSISTRDRNTEMWARVVDDPVYQKEAQDQWATLTAQMAPPPSADGSPPPPFPQEAIDAVIAEVKANVDIIRARGGDVAFMRFPYDGGFQPVEDFGFPRERFWDPLVMETDSASVSWHDHQELQGYEIPEWSHLDPREAERYTRAVTPIFYARIDEKKAARAAIND